MSDEDAIHIPTPVLEEHEAAAIFAVLIRVLRVDLNNKWDRERIAEMQAKIDERSASRPKLIAALDAFGFQSDKDELWERVKIALGKKRFWNAWHIAFPDRFDEHGRRYTAAEPEVTVETPEDALKEEAAQVALSEQPTPKISDAILEYVRSKASQGARVADVKKYLLEKYGIETHEKTPGMTLYRLSREGLVERHGRDWFSTEASQKPDLSLSDSRNTDVVADQ